MLKLTKPTKPLGVGRGYGFSSVSSTKPASKVGIKSDKTESTDVVNGDVDDDHKSVKKKSVKLQEVDTLKRRKLALSRDQIKTAKISPITKLDAINKQPNVTRKSSTRTGVTPNNSKTLQSNESKAKLTNRPNLVISNKTTKEENGSLDRVSKSKLRSTKESPPSANQETKSNVSRLKVKFVFS